MMKRKLGLVAAATAALVVLAGCSATPPADEGGKDITLWVMGGDTPDALRDYLKTEYASATGGTLTIEQQDWSDALSKLTTALHVVAHVHERRRLLRHHRSRSRARR